MWKDQRKFLHDKLRNLGMSYMGAGKKVMETRIMVSVVKRRSLTVNNQPVNFSPYPMRSEKNVLEKKRLKFRAGIKISMIT